MYSTDNMGPICRLLFLLCCISTIFVFACGQRLDARRRIRHHCPAKCYCLTSGAAVRCMHAQLVRIPRVERDTLLLDLRYNNIREISANDFRGLPRLDKLLLNNNHLHRVPANAFANLPTLTTLSLYKNRISFIHEDAFFGLQSLEQLYIYNNDITTLDDKVFSHLPKLDRLFMQNNLIMTLPEGLFNGLPSLRRLRLDNNRLTCDCEILWFAKLLNSWGGRTQATATCRSPRALYGRSISDIPLVDFKCSPPIFITQPDSLQVRSGEPIYLSCTVSGSPQPTVAWFKNGQQVFADTRRRITTGGSLIIISPKKKDEGQYKCTASNTAGKIESREAKVVFYDLSAGPPFFITKPEVKKVRASTSFELECKAGGVPIPTIQWSKNGTEVVTGNGVVVTESGSLHFGTTSSSDSGVYKCTARNSQGVISTKITLSVLSPPIFTQEPTDVEVLQGESATILCRYTGDPTPTVSWLKDGEALPRDQRYLIMLSGDLLIRATNSADDGRYTCVIENSEGTSESHAQLSVSMQPNFIHRPQNQRVRQGNTVDFPCKASGIPQPHIVWTVNGRAIPNNNRYHVLPSGTLRILRVETSDAGLLRCEAANLLGARHADVTLEVIPFQAIQFSRTPEDLNVDSGEEARISCEVRQDSNSLTTTLVSWTKDSVGIVASDERYSITPAPNSLLIIHDVGQDDAGRYECIARRGSLTSRASMTLTVNVRSSTEEITSKLFEILPTGCLQQGCSGNTDIPSNITEEEITEALRSIGVDRNERTKRQAVGSGLKELSNRISVVSNNVDGAINNTIHTLNDRRHKQTASDLLALMRFPSTLRGVNMMRAAEVFEVSLQLIECCIKRGMKLRKFALTHNDFVRDENLLKEAELDTADDGLTNSSTPVLGTEIVSVVANLSGCSAHQKIPDCSAEICYHRKYRTADGTCNNLQHPMWGAALTPFHRLLKPIYENGFNSPVGWDHDKLYNGRTLPSARRVSLEVLVSREARPADDAEFTHMTMQWGQFLDHDIDFTTMAPSIKRFSDGEACKDSCKHDAPCFPIHVHGNDPRRQRFHHHATHHRPSQGVTSSCMEFTRSSAVCGSGITSVFFSALSRREQINQITSYIDASNVYGSGLDEMKNLRDLSTDLGLLKEGQPLEPGQKALLPYNVYSDLESELSVIRPVAPIECRRSDSESPQERSVPCFLCGDLRCNEHVSLTAMHTMWMREHNRLARKLKEFNPGWNSDTIFNEARKIVGAQMQHITHSHWLPKILGPYFKKMGDYRMYDPNSPASIVNVFATAAYRFGHTMINPIMHRLNETWGVTEHGNLMLHQAFFAPYRIIHQGGIDPLVRGLISKPMKARASDSNMNIELVERLFELVEDVALDLGALNIQRGRDHALPFYNDWREYCNLTRANTFDDLAEEISNTEVRQRLQNIYGSPHNIDAFVGMILEDVTPDSRLGPTLACIIAEQFRRVRDNDRFWYENPGVFKPSQLTEIRQTSLAMIICENTDGISNVPKDVFQNTPISDFVSCNEIPRLDLTAWKECCESCTENDDIGNTLSAHVRRQRRSAESANSNLHSSTRKKGQRKSKRHQWAPVSLVDRHKELAWTKSLVAESNSKEILDISKTSMNKNDKGAERIQKVVAQDEFDKHSASFETRQNIDTSPRPDHTGKDMARLLSVIETLESKLATLQDEVQRLGGNLDK